MRSDDQLDPVRPRSEVDATGLAQVEQHWRSDSAGYITGNWIEVDGGLHRSAF